MTKDTRRDDPKKTQDDNTLSAETASPAVDDKNIRDADDADDQVQVGAGVDKEQQPKADKVGSAIEDGLDKDRANEGSANKDEPVKADLPGTQAILVTPPQDDPKQSDEKKREAEGFASKDEPRAQSPKNSFAEDNAENIHEKRPKKSHKKWWILGFVILILVGLAGITYFLYQEAKSLAAEQAEDIEALSQQLTSLRSATRATMSELENATASNQEKLQGLSNLENNVKNRLSDLEARTSAQAKRLLAMSDTSREDWLLAEAEYLLKLANQRVRIERSAEGSEALLEEADAILRDLEDPSLHNLRRAIAKDLAALRLMNKIDVEGIYLTLVSMAEKSDALPLRSDIITRSKEKVASKSPVADQDLSFWQQIKRSFREFLTSFKSYIAIDSHSEKPEVLAPDSAVYIHQNLRLKLERAQLALLREQQDIYRQSIDQAQAWARDYYPSSEPRRRFIETLETLKAKNVVQELPDISESLNLLHEYIENLHLLKGAFHSAPIASQQELG